MSTAPSARRSLAACTLTVGVWTVLLALFAMHGLPVQTPGAMQMSAPTVASSVPTQTHVHGASSPDVAPNVFGGDAAPSALSDPGQACAGSDHCVATLRTADAAATPAVLDRASRAADRYETGRPLVAPVRTAHPPDLDTLQISRT